MVKTLTYINAIRKLTFAILIITICLPLQHDRQYKKYEQYNYCISSEFNEFDTKAITTGLEEWNLLGATHFKHSEELCDVLIRPITRADFPKLKPFYQDPYLLGLADYRTNSILIYIDRIYTEDEMSEVALHEGGHWLGLQHVSMKYWAIMNPYKRCGIIFRFYKEDIKEYCRHWNCNNINIDRIIEYYDRTTSIPDCDFGFNE